MATDPSVLSGLFKEVYGDEINNLIPNVVKAVKMVPFVTEEKQPGNYYHQPVIVSDEQGVTYAGPTDGAFSLNAAVAMNMQDGQVRGSQMLLRSSLSYDAASKAASSKKAFEKATSLIVKNMMRSIMKRLEIGMFYGTKGVGSAASSVNTNTTTTVVQVSTASWATGIWAGSKNAKIQFYNGSSLASSGADSVFTISVVDIANRKLTVTGSTTGISALDTAIAGNVHDIFFYGAKSKEFSGIDAIITNTTTLFNIDAASWEMWKGSSYSAGSAQLTMGKILSAAQEGVQRGLEEDATVWLNPRSWANVASDLAAAREFDGSYSKEEGANGFKSIKFYSMNGLLELVPHSIIKEGEAFIVPMKKVKRIGSQDVSFQTPGKNDEIFLHLADSAGYEMRVFTDQAVFIETPAQCVKITSIVNAA